MKYWTAPGGLVTSPRRLRCTSASGIVVNVVGKVGAGMDWADVHALELAGVTGDVTVWSTPGGWGGKLDQDNEWTLHYKQTHAQTSTPLFERRKIRIKLERALRVTEGRCVGLYVHTTGWGGMVALGSIASSRGIALHHCSALPPPQLSQPHLEPAYSADHLTVRSGCAKTWSPSPFGEVRQWGLHRELNGSLHYHVKWRCWTPRNHGQFPARYRHAADSLLLCLGHSRLNIPADIIAVVLRFCHAEWFSPSPLST